MYWTMYWDLFFLEALVSFPVFILVLFIIRKIYRDESWMSQIVLVLFWGCFYLISTILMISFIWAISPLLSPIIAGGITILLAWIIRFALNHNKHLSQA